MEQHGISISDREIALEADLPYQFRYDKNEDCFQTGAMLQTPEDYNRCLSKYGLHFTEIRASKADTIPVLLRQIPCMVGIWGEYGKHAMVYTGCVDGVYEFLNPHRKEDGQEDVVRLTEQELIQALDDCNAVGFLESGVSNSLENTSKQSIAALNLYQKRMHLFAQTLHTREQLMACRDALLRPFAIDLPVMMQLVGEHALSEQLSEWAKQVFELFHAEECIPGAQLDMALFDSIWEQYQTLLFHHK